MSSIIEELQNYSGFIMAILTFVLILITVYYARQTYILNRVTREISEYERRPIITIVSDYDDLHRPHFGIKNMGSRPAEDIYIKAQAIFGLSNKHRGVNILDTGPEKPILPNLKFEYKISQLIPNEDARTDIFDKVIERLIDLKYIAYIHPENICGYHDSYGNWITFPYRNEMNWSLIDSSQFLHGTINIEAEFKSDKNAVTSFSHQQRYQIQIVPATELENTNRVYKNFAIITTWGLVNEVQGH